MNEFVNTQSLLMVDFSVIILMLDTVRRHTVVVEDLERAVNICDPLQEFL